MFPNICSKTPKATVNEALPYQRIKNIKPIYQLESLSLHTDTIEIYQI